MNNRPYVSEIRYHCWITEEPLKTYIKRVEETGQIQPISDGAPK